MGNGCSKNIRRLNKNTIAPNHVIEPSTPITTNHIEPIKCQVTQTTVTKKPNRIEIGPVGNQAFTTNRLESISRLEPSNSIGKTDARNPCSSSNVDPDIFNLSSCIDTQSIIFDRSEPKPIKPLFTRSISVDSSSDKTDKSAEVKRFSISLHRLFRSNQNLTTTTSNPVPKTTENHKNFPKLYHRLSGSVQSLFTGNLNNNRKRNLSASDTNLNRINPRCGLTQQQLIDNDYCPSVLYNRKARKSYSEKNLDKTQTFSRWKNQLWLKFSRKKSNPSARKS